MRGITYDIIPPTISDTFDKSKLPSKTIVAIHTKEQRDTVNLIKTFYLKYPQYRWITFRDMRGLSEFEFANTLKECCLSIWIDDESGFGTFPLESMKSNVPVIGKIPNLPAEWMTEDNGVWITDKNLIVDVIADFIQNWLEDNIKPEIYDEMKKTADKYSNKQEFESSVTTLFESFLNNRAKSFEEQTIKTEE
jgi:glycosyltransferase involved in cell wall biosynthesis